MASPMPSRNPLFVVSGVLKSAWASNQTIPTFSSERALEAGHSPHGGVAVAREHEGEVTGLRGSAHAPGDAAEQIEGGGGLGTERPLASNTSTRTSRPAVASSPSIPGERRCYGTWLALDTHHVRGRTCSIFPPLIRDPSSVRCSRHLPPSSYKIFPTSG